VSIDGDRGGNKSVEKKRSKKKVEKKRKCWIAKHSIVGSEVATTSPSFLECEERK